MRGEGRVARGALAALSVALFLAGPEAGAGKSFRTRKVPLPEWVKEAMARPLPEEARGLARLHEEVLVEPLAEGGVRVTERRAVKVLDSSALEEASEGAVFYQGDDEILSHEAWNVLPDGSVKRADEDEDAADYPYIEGFEVFDDSRLHILSAPGVRVGSVVAFESVVLEDLDIGAYPFLFGDDEHHTAFSRFTLRTPEGWGFEAVPLRLDEVEPERDETGFRYTLTALAPLEHEDLRPPSLEVLPLLWARWWSPDGSRGYEDWSAMGRWYRDLTAEASDQPGEARTIGEGLKPVGPAGLLPAIEKAFDFAARDVRYVAIEVGVGGYRPHTPAQVCKLRYGDCKDKSFLVRSLVSSWEVPSHPVLVRTADRGPVLPGVPTPGQFNHCIVAVSLPEGVGEDLWATTEVEGLGRFLFLDPTVSNGDAWSLPTSDQGTLGLLVHREGAELVRLPVQPPEAAAAERVIRASLDEQGMVLEARLEERWEGTRAIGIRGYYEGRSAAEHRQAALEDLQSRFPGAKITEYRIEGLEEVSGPVVETTTVTGGRVGKRVGPLLIVEPDRMGFGVISSRLPPPPRHWPLDVGSPREERLDVTIEGPVGWVPEEVPEPFEHVSDFLEARCEWSVEENRLRYRRTLRLLESEVPPERYESFRDEVGRIGGAARQGIVFVQD